MPALSATLCAAAIVLLASAPVLADGNARVLLADGDPELERAVKTTLAPWKLEVVVDTATPVTDVQARGDARFVVWRENGDLVVFDRERGESEHREAPTGALDPASAAAAALTVKTLMRLPPPEAVADTSLPPVYVETPAPIVESRPELRAQVGFGVRTAVVRGRRGSSARSSIAALVKPTGLPLRLGVIGEIGTDNDVDGGGFKGTWSDWSVAALATWTFSLSEVWEIEPYGGGGVLRSKLDGTQNMSMMSGDERHERSTLGLVRAGVFVRARLGWISTGAGIGGDVITNNPTYKKMGMGAEIFEVPRTTGSVNAFVAVDF